MTSKQYKIFRGDDNPIEVTLLNNQETFIISGSDEISAGFVYNKQLVQTGLVDLNHANVDFTKSKIIIQFTAAQTQGLPLGYGELHIKRNGLTYVVEDVEVVQGYL